jgi:predicted HicB family RNase H-like nuclease
MTLTIEIAEELQAVLKNQAQAQGVSEEQYARRVLGHDLKSGGGPRKHISEVCSR